MLKNENSNIEKQPDINQIGVEKGKVISEIKFPSKISSNDSKVDINLDKKGLGLQNSLSSSLSLDFSNKKIIIDELLNMNCKEINNLDERIFAPNLYLNQIQLKQLSLLIRLFKVLSFKANDNLKLEEILKLIIEKFEEIEKDKQIDFIQCIDQLMNPRFQSSENELKENKKEEIKPVKEEMKIEEKISRPVKALKVDQNNDSINFFNANLSASRIRKVVFTLSKIFLVYKKEFQQVFEVMKEEFNELEKIYPMTVDERMEYNRRKDAIQIKEQNEKELEIKNAANKNVNFPYMEGSQNIIIDSSQNIKASIPPNQFAFQNQRINFIPIFGKIDGAINHLQIIVKNERIIDLTKFPSEGNYILSLMEMKFQNPKALIIKKENFLSSKKIGNTTLSCRAEISQFHSFISKNSKYIEELILGDAIKPNYKYSPNDLFLSISKCKNLQKFEISG